MNNKLVQLNSIEARLATLATIDEAKEIRDQAEALRVYAKSAKAGLGIQNRAARIKLLSEHRAGELLRECTRVQGKRNGEKGLRSSLERSGISVRAASNWQSIATLPAESITEAEARLTAEGKELTSAGMLSLAKNGVHFSSDTPEWETPNGLFDLLNSEFAFELDVCATKENAKCQRFFSRKDDGLKQEWTGSCWMNPPYGEEIKAWVAKAWESSLQRAHIVCLVPARIDTEWWWRFCRFGEVRFLRGRLRFGGGQSGAPFPSAVVIFPSKPTVIWWEQWPRD